MVLISADLQIKDALKSGMLENDLSKNKRFPASNSSNISSEVSNINKHELTKFPIKSKLLWALYDFPETWTQVLTLLSLDHFLTHSQSDVTWPRNVISTEHLNIQQTVVLPYVKQIKTW